ncbi:hypothetical protein AAC387_Pa04g2137 [Persea americana]
MSQHQGDENDHLEENHEMEDVNDAVDEGFRGREMDYMALYDDDRYDFMDNRITDTSSAQAMRGKDIQGIPWERLSVTKEKYRRTRLQRYRNYEDIPRSGEESGKEMKPAKKGSMFYDFRSNKRAVNSSIHHFQLRNLVWATSKHDVYLLSEDCFIHWSALTCNKSEVLDLSGHVTPSENHPGNLSEGLTETLVSTFAVKDKLLVAGGFNGEIICKYLDRPGVSFCFRTPEDDNRITNSIEIYDSSSGAVHFMATNNDCGVRDFDTEKFQLSKNLQFPWSVNHASVSPDGKLFVVVGDNPNGLLVDYSTEMTIATLCGHLDFSFASAWHPDGCTFATGNQDKSCRIWDIRNLSKSVAVLKGNLSAIRGIRFTSDGKFMAMAEAADFVHVFDTSSGYRKEQEIDFFGEISGVSFSPDTESLFIGIWDRTYGSLLQYSRNRSLSYLDPLI